MTDWVIAGFEIAGSPKYGIDVRVTDRITVQGNHVQDSALTGIFTAFSNDVLIQNNETDHNTSTESTRATAQRIPPFAATIRTTTLPRAFT
jgi:parallel beta-helix repeat protein